MKKTAAVILVLVLAAVATSAQDRAKGNIKATRIAVDDIAVSCRDNTSPQVKDLENGVVVVSCSK
jgi:hypothetical protein